MKTDSKRCHQPTRGLKARENRWHPRDLIAVCAVQTRPSTESMALLTSQIRTWLMSLSQGCSNSFLHSPYFSFILISSSPDFDVFEPSTCCSHDKLHAHVIRKHVLERVRVRCSVFFGQRSSALWSQNFREAVSDLFDYHHAPSGCV